MSYPNYSPNVFFVSATQNSITIGYISNYLEPFIPVVGYLRIVCEQLSIDFTLPEGSFGEYTFNNLQANTSYTITVTGTLPSNGQQRSKVLVYQTTSPSGGNTTSVQAAVRAGHTLANNEQLFTNNPNGSQATVLDDLRIEQASGTNERVEKHTSAYITVPLVDITWTTANAQEVLTPIPFTTAAYNTPANTYPRAFFTVSHNNTLLPVNNGVVSFPDFGSYTIVVKAYYQNTADSPTHLVAQKTGLVYILQDFPPEPPPEGGHSCNGEIFSYTISADGTVTYGGALQGLSHLAVHRHPFLNSLFQHVHYHKGVVYDLAAPYTSEWDYMKGTAPVHLLLKPFYYQEITTATETTVLVQCRNITFDTHGLPVIPPGWQINFPHGVVVSSQSLEETNEDFPEFVTSSVSKTMEIITRFTNVVLFSD